MNQTITGNGESGEAALPVLTLPADEYDAILFDLDGVLTSIAAVHAAARKERSTNSCISTRQHAARPSSLLDLDSDYRLHVDGKPRRDGFISFLHARGIDLPIGTPDSETGTATGHALGQSKNRYFLERLAQTGVKPRCGAPELVRALRDWGIKTAVVSSRKNCKAVLEATNMTALFDVRVDGVDLTRLRLRSKPAPDSFLEVARRLGVEPSRAVVIEDALAATTGFAAPSRVASSRTKTW